jgi:hypothetical protein
MSFSVSVLCVLCAFVAKNPLSVVVLHRTRIVAARRSTTPCLKGARYSLNVGHFRPSAPRLSLYASAHRMTTTIAMSSNVIIFIVNLHPLPSGTPLKRFKCGGLFQPSTVHRPSSVSSPPNGCDIMARYRSRDADDAHPSNNACGMLGRRGPLSFQFRLLSLLPPVLAPPFHAGAFQTSWLLTG